MKYDTTSEQYRSDKMIDSELRKNGEIELCFDGTFNGNFKIVFNDSIYFVGDIFGNPYSGLFDKRFKLKKQNDANNIMILENLDNNVFTSFQLSTKCSHIVVEFEPHSCELLIVYVNKRVVGRG